MRRRYFEVFGLLVVVAVAAWWFGRAQPSAGLHYDPGGARLTFNGVKPGDSLADLEKRWGPPDFKNPQASFQQWERPLTQMHYNKQGLVVDVEGSGTGLLRQGEVELLRCGDPEERVEAVFGAPATHRDNFYRYPFGLVIHCGSESQGKRWVSHIQLELR